MIKLHSKKLGALQLNKEDIGLAKNTIFPGAEVMLSQPPLKEYVYLIQQFKLPLFTLRYYCISSSFSDVLTVETKPSFTFRIGYSHSHQMISKALGKQVFHERGYNFFFDPNPSVKYPIEANDRFIFMDLLPKIDYLHYLQAFFPVTEEIIEKAKDGQAAKFTPQNQVAPTEAWRWHEDLLDWCFQENKNEESGLALCNCLVESCIRASRPNWEKKTNLTIKEVNKICEAAEIVLKCSDTFTVEELATKFRLSPQKLDEGFKDIFGYPVLQHQFENKMLYALRLLDARDATLELVASELEYSPPETFLKEFTQRFGYDPFKKKKEER
jgi:AraC-like DNA-binding protein